jgi:hypothetical protein
MKNMNMHDMATIIAIYFINSELIRSLFNKYESVNSITFVATKIKVPARIGLLLPNFYNTATVVE